MKTFFKWVMCGAATYLGYFLCKEAIDTTKDPYRKAKLKKKVSKIKDAISEKTES